jgi:hypothetical protein
MSADQTDWTDSPPFDLNNSVEAYADGIARIVVVGPNVRMTLFAWRGSTVPCARSLRRKSSCHRRRSRKLCWLIGGGGSRTSMPKSFGIRRPFAMRTWLRHVVGVRVTLS